MSISLDKGSHSRLRLRGFAPDMILVAGGGHVVNQVTDFRISYPFFLCGASLLTDPFPFFYLFFFITAACSESTNSLFPMIIPIAHSHFPSHFTLPTFAFTSVAMITFSAQLRMMIALDNRLFLSVLINFDDNIQLLK